MLLFLFYSAVLPNHIPPPCPLLDLLGGSVSSLVYLAAQVCSLLDQVTPVLTPAVIFFSDLLLVFFFLPFFPIRALNPGIMEGYLLLTENVLVFYVYQKDSREKTSCSQFIEDPLVWRL